MIADIIITPPIKTLAGGISSKNSHTQKGANKVSDNINKPTVTDAVDLEPIVMQINPKVN